MPIIEVPLLKQELEQKLRVAAEEYVNALGMRLGSAGWPLTAVGQEFERRMGMFVHAMPIGYYLEKAERLASQMWEDAGYPSGGTLDFWMAAQKHVATIACRTVATADTIADATKKLTEVFETFAAGAYLEGIRKAAYFIWEASGRTSGHALEDWLEAEARALALHGADPVYFETGWGWAGRTSDSAARGGGKEPPAPAYVRFSVYHPKEIKPQVWCTLLAYVHILEMQSTVEADAKQRLEVPHGRRTAVATHGIFRGAEITISPELPGCRFNPTSARLLWLEDWHRVEFRLQAQTDLPSFELGKAVNGRVTFYVETVLVGEIPIWACISDQADTTSADVPTSTASAEPYEAIFVSYAHEDSAVVNRLGRAYRVLGMEFLRDVEKLRSGEEWNPALLAMIERANIFQLYWSRAAKHSLNVEAEWRHALEQSRSHFIRPLYWQVPMPKPPSELARLHFSYLELDN